MSGTGRQFFNESEKICLQELIIKYKLNSMATTMGNAAAKKASWTRLTEEYNTIETNTKRTESQLKKCWDNLKNRRKNILAQEKRERMKTGGGYFNPSLPSTSNQSSQILEDALTEQTDVELVNVIDSDYIIPSNEDVPIESEILLDIPQLMDAASNSRTQNFNDATTDGDLNMGVNVASTPPHRSESRLTDYGVAPSQGSRNIRTRVIQEEFSIRQRSYKNSQKREEDLHKLRITEKEWMVRATEEHYYKVKAEREAAEELLHCNRTKREEAELCLAMLRNKK